MSDPLVPEVSGILATARTTGAAQFRIDRAGVWYYLDTPILREAMVRLFASLLRRRGDLYVLQAPDQIIRIDVEDAPFIVVDCSVRESEGEPTLVLQTNIGDSFPLCLEYPMQMRAAATGGERRPYQMLRNGIMALIHRNVYYRLVDLAETEQSSGGFGVRSAGSFFPLD